MWSLAFVPISKDFFLSQRRFSMAIAIVYELCGGIRRPVFSLHINSQFSGMSVVIIGSPQAIASIRALD